MNMVASLFNLAGPELILIGAFTAFTVWMPVHCSMNGKAAWGIAGWFLAIFCVPLFGPLVYFFGRKIVHPRRGKSASAVVAPLAFFAALMASVASAAAQITYSLTPITLQDQLNPAYTDTLTGTILLAGTGSYTVSADPNELLTYSLTMTSGDASVPSVTASGSMTLSETENFEGTLTATDSALILSYGGNFEFLGGPGYYGSPYVFAQWDDASGNQLYFYAGESDSPATMQMVAPDGNTVLGNGNWTIGTAEIPEPVSLLPLGLGWVAFWLCTRRRHSANRQP